MFSNEPKMEAYRLIDEMSKIIFDEDVKNKMKNPRSNKFKFTHPRYREGLKV